MLAIVVL